jgi:hypothetical protein
MTTEYDSVLAVSQMLIGNRKPTMSADPSGGFSPASQVCGQTDRPGGVFVGK